MKRWKPEDQLDSVGPYTGKQPSGETVPVADGRAYANEGDPSKRGGCALCRGSADGDGSYDDRCPECRRQLAHPLSAAQLDLDHQEALWMAAAPRDWMSLPLCGYGPEERYRVRFGSEKYSRRLRWGNANDLARMQSGEVVDAVTLEPVRVLEEAKA